MSQISDVTGVVAGLLLCQGGLQAQLEEAAAAEQAPGIKIPPQQIVSRNMAPEVAEKSTATRYPAVHVYCEKYVNDQREKFRTFSGEAQMAIDLRVSSDRVEELEPQMNLLLDALTSTLDQNRGDLGSGVFYGGGYEITPGPVKPGGRNFLQTAKVTFNLEVSRD